MNNKLYLSLMRKAKEYELIKKYKHIMCFRRKNYNN